MPNIHLGRLERAKLLLDVTRRQHQAAVDFWDGNWLLTDVSIEMGGWRGHFEASLRAEEFERFLEGVHHLCANLGSTAQFATMEGWLSLRLLGDGNGHIEVHGIATDQPGVGDTLEFRLDIDQTDLPSLISELQAVLAEFPVIGARPT